MTNDPNHPETPDSCRRDPHPGEDLTCSQCGCTDHKDCFDGFGDGIHCCPGCGAYTTVTATAQSGDPTPSYNRTAPRPGEHLLDMPRIPHSPDAPDDSRFTYSVRKCKEEKNCVVLTKHWPKNKPNADGDYCDDIHLDADRVPDIVAAMLEHAPASVTPDLIPELRRLLEAIRSEITPSPATRLARAGIRAIDARDPSINHGGTEMSDPQSHQPAAEGHHPESQSHQPPAQSQEAAPDPAAEAPDFAEIREIAERVLELDASATPGPWVWRLHGCLIGEYGCRPIVLDAHESEIRVGHRSDSMGGLMVPLAKSPDHPDPELIAHYRNHAPTLARAVLDLTERVARLERDRDEGTERRIALLYELDEAQEEASYCRADARDFERMAEEADADRDAALQRAEQLERELDDLRRTIELHTQSNQIGPMWEQIQSLRAARDAALARAEEAEAVVERVREILMGNGPLEQIFNRAIDILLQKKGTTDGR